MIESTELESTESEWGGDDDLDPVPGNEDELEDDPDDIDLEKEEEEEEEDEEEDEEEEEEEEEDEEEEKRPILDPNDTIEAVEREFVVRYDEDIEDEFADFVDDELGYTEIDWDTLPEREVDRHHKIRAMNLEETKAVKLGRISDFCRWAVARTLLAHNDEAGFHEIALPLIASKKRSPALDYIDILLALMSRSANRKDFDQAFELLGRFSDLATDEAHMETRFRGILTIQRGDIADGLEILAQLAEQHANAPGFLLSIGEDLCGLHLPEEALEYLEIAKELTREQNDQELLASIESAVQYAQRCIRYDDAAEPEEDF